MTVWIVSLEWNLAPSEVTGETGIVGVFTNAAAANRCAIAERRELDNLGHTVYEWSMAAGTYCAFCGADAPENPDGTRGLCPCDPRHAPEKEAAWCDHCGAELTESGDCHNDHDEWDIDVHVTEHEVKA